MQSGTNKSRACRVAGLSSFWLRASRATLLFLVISGGAVAGCSGSDEESIERQNEAAGPARTGTPGPPQGRTLDEPTPDIERPGREGPPLGESREESVFDLRVGDCILGDLDAATQVELSTVTLVNCASPEAKFLLLDAFTVEPAEGPWPGQPYIDEQLGLCPVQTTLPLYPTAESWEQGDRTIQCFDDLTQESVFELAAGDCFSHEGGGEVIAVTIEDCSSATATYQVLDAFIVENSEGPWPGQAYIDEQAAFWCPLQTDNYLGPIEESWARGDRTVLCIDHLGGAYRATPRARLVFVSDLISRSV